MLVPVYLPWCGGSGHDDDCAAAIYTDGDPTSRSAVWRSSTLPLAEGTRLRGWFPASESVLAETATGEVLFNGRPVETRLRVVAVSQDGGGSFSQHGYAVELPDPACQGSLLGLDGGKVLAFSGAHSAHARVDMTVMLANATNASHGTGGMNLTWRVDEDVDPGRDAAYSCLVDMGNDELGLLYEGAKHGAEGPACSIRFVSIVH